MSSLFFGGGWFPFAPTAHLIIARSFNCGLAIKKNLRPNGAAENGGGTFRSSLRDFDYRWWLLPAVKTAGYFQLPLCGIDCHNPASDFCPVCPASAAVAVSVQKLAV